MTTLTKESLIALGGKVWVKDDKERVYISADIFNSLFPTNFSDKSNKFFFDCKTEKLMRSYKGKKPTVEA